jgi:DNA damage-inducible protein 1
VDLPSNFFDIDDISPKGRDVDMLLGLDMLKAHQACIDLERNCLRIQGQEIRFLSEHELPDKARDGRQELLEEEDVAHNPMLQSPAPPQPPSSRTSEAVPPSRGNISHTGSGQYSEQAIATLVGLGATREQALTALRSAGGNVDLAASFLFNF